MVNRLALLMAAFALLLLVGCGSDGPGLCADFEASVDVCAAACDSVPGTLALEHECGTCHCAVQPEPHDHGDHHDHDDSEDHHNRWWWHDHGHRKGFPQNLIW